MKDCDALVNYPEIKARLMANGSKVITAGDFGMPTFVINNKVFWSDDACEMVLD